MPIPFWSVPKRVLWITPSRRVLSAETRNATVSPSNGPVAEALACTKRFSPRLSSSLAEGVNSGARLMTLIAPAVVFLPNSVPCGPRSTSIRSMSVKSNAAVAGRA